jgi:hypothetical protein
MRNRVVAIKLGRCTQICTLVIGLAWLSTGGVVVHKYWFDPSDSVGQEFKPYIRIDALSRNDAFGVPFLFEYFGDGAPISLRLTYLTHTLVPEPTVIFDSLALGFPDGTTKDITGCIGGQVAPIIDRHLYIDEMHKQHNVASLRLQIIIDDVVGKPTPFNVRLKGELRSQGRSVEPFEFSLDFVPHYQVETFTGWHWLIVSGL